MRLTNWLKDFFRYRRSTPIRRRLHARRQSMSRNGQIEILEDRILLTLAIAADDSVKAEGNQGPTNFTFTVTRSNDTAGTTTVNYAVSGTPVTGTDFVGGVLPSGTVTFADGETTQTITILVNG